MDRLSNEKYYGSFLFLLSFSILSVRFFDLKKDQLSIFTVPGF